MAAFIEIRRALHAWKLANKGAEKSTAATDNAKWQEPKDVNSSSPHSLRSVVIHRIHQGPDKHEDNVQGKQNAKRYNHIEFTDGHSSKSCGISISLFRRHTLLKSAAKTTVKPLMVVFDADS